MKWKINKALLGFYRNSFIIRKQFRTGDFLLTNIFQTWSYVIKQLPKFI